MMATKSIKETILAELKTKAIVSIPASEADYLSVAADLPFKVEYHDSEIVTMGLATPKHEALVMNIGTILNILFSENEDLLVYGSNVGVQIPRFEGGYYLPDVMIVKGELELIAKSNCIISNPYIIVEVLSPATLNLILPINLPSIKHSKASNKLFLLTSIKYRLLRISVLKNQIRGFTKTAKLWKNPSLSKIRRCYWLLFIGRLNLRGE